MVAEDREDFGAGAFAPSNAILVVVTAVALGTAALLALTHDGGSARTAVHPGTEIEAVRDAAGGREESTALEPVTAKPQLVVYIVKSEVEAAALGETLSLRAMLSFQFPDYANLGMLQTSVVVAGTPEIVQAWKQELDWAEAEGVAITVHDLTRQ